MKKIIRNSVFESNSSSSHAISIVRIGLSDNGRLPRGSEDVFILKPCNKDGTYQTEIEKAEFMLGVIAHYIYEHVNCNLIFEDTIELNQLVWFKELLEKEIGTKIKFEQDYNWFPYFDGAHDTNYDLEEIFKFNWLSKNEFIKNVQDIIFNDGIIIEYSIEEY